MNGVFTNSWKDKYTDNKKLTEVCDKYFNKDRVAMADALAFNRATLATWLAPDAEVPPHATRAAELYVQAQMNNKNSTLKMYITVIDKEAEDKLFFAVKMLGGDIQELKGYK